MIRIISTNLQPMPDVSKLAPGTQLPAQLFLPSIWIVCDYRSCASNEYGPLNTQSSRDQQQSVAKFIAEKGMEGWSVSVDGHYCPACHRVRTENHKRAVESINRISVAGPGDLHQIQKLVPPPGSGPGSSNGGAN